MAGQLLRCGLCSTPVDIGGNCCCGESSCHPIQGQAAYVLKKPGYVKILVDAEVVAAAETEKITENNKGKGVENITKGDATFSVDQDRCLIDLFIITKDCDEVIKLFSAKHNTCYTSDLGYVVRKFNAKYNTCFTSDELQGHMDLLKEKLMNLFKK